MKKTILALLLAGCLLVTQYAKSQSFPVQFQTLPVYFYALAGNFFTPTNGLLGCMGGIVRTTDGATWDTVYAGEYGIVSMTFSENQQAGYALYTDAFGQMPKILKTTNQGLNWVQSTPTDNFYQLLAWKNQVLAVATGNELYRSLDSGTSWQQVSGRTVGKLSADRDNVYFAAGRYFWKSSDLSTWTPSLTPVDAITNSSAADGYNLVCGREFLSDEHPSIAYTSDYGASWQQSTNLDMFGDASNVLHTSKGIFVTVTDNVQTYQQGQLFVIQNGVWRKLVDTLAVFTGLAQSGDYVLCYGYLSGEFNSSILLTIPLTVTSTPADPPVQPQGYGLQQNYPNPFNPATSISFTLPRTSHVSLKVYDMTGRTVAQLVNEKRNAGTHTVTFNAAALSSGTYFYAFEADGFRETKKMILAK